MTCLGFSKSCWSVDFVCALFSIDDLINIMQMDYEDLKDEDIVSAILRRDSEVTTYFLYKKCYPLFKSIYDRYYTDCASWNELATEIYVYIMMPGKKTGICKLAALLQEVRKKARRRSLPRAVKINRMISRRKSRAIMIDRKSVV